MTILNLLALLIIVGALLVFLGGKTSKRIFAYAAGIVIIVASVIFIGGLLLGVF